MIKLLLLRLLAPILGRATWAAYPLAGLVGWAAWHTRRGTRRRLIRNLLPFCDGDQERARREGLRAYQNVARYWVDLCSLPYRELKGFERRHITIEHPERMAALEAPGPVVAISAHTGNPEFAIQSLTYRGRAFVAVVEELRPRRFSRELLRRRSSAGGKFYEANFGGVRACLDALHRGELVGLMGDRDIQDTGICTELAGRRVKLPRGPWEIARRTNALVLPVLTRRDSRDNFTVRLEEPFRMEVTGDPESDVRKAVERWAEILEAHIRREPAQWAVLEDFWAVHRCG
ncbi:MAG: lysophospholipid acyltransferase family protein [Dehalococcoidia bacterium]|nr:lysophospholipid acyltransferase family protein [Dehalococcoidia bacterium]